MVKKRQQTNQKQQPATPDSQPSTDLTDDQLQAVVGGLTIKPVESIVFHPGPGPDPGPLANEIIFVGG
ncbi:MAG TPA: hypothetical protein VKT82_06285 [Ktedonobacterales bacterium]|nr:hypothetical protein [Ktedonobacterales bacterium]